MDQLMQRGNTPPAILMGCVHLALIRPVIYGDLRRGRAAKDRKYEVPLQLTVHPIYETRSHLPLPWPFLDLRVPS